MLGKLIKHEFHATSRTFLALYAFVIVLTPIFSLIMRLFGSDDGILSNTLVPMSVFGYIVMLIALFMASFVLIVMRFYRTTATSEAYLTFTLPVSTHQILLSKWIVASIWQIMAFVVFVISLLSMLFISGVVTPSTFFNYAELILMELGEFESTTGFNFWGFLIIVGAAALVGTLTSTLQYFFSIIAGQIFRDHRVIASIGIYVAVYTVLQFVSALVIFPLMFIFDPATIETASGASDFTNLVYLITIILNLVLGAIFYFATAFIMKKKLNVQ